MLFFISHLLKNDSEELSWYSTKRNKFHGTLLLGEDVSMPMEVDPVCWDNLAAISAAFLAANSAEIACALGKNHESA